MSLPEWKSVVYEVFHFSLDEQSKISLILDILYGDQIIRSIALDVFKKYLSIVKNSNAVVSYDLLYQIFQSLMSDLKWFEKLAHQFSVSNTDLEMKKDDFNSDNRYVTIIYIHLLVTRGGSRLFWRGQSSRKSNVLN